MAEIYLNQRADECRMLASRESDPALVAVLRELEHDYRLKAQRALAVLPGALRGGVIPEVADEYPDLLTTNRIGLRVRSRRKATARRNSVPIRPKRRRRR